MKSEFASLQRDVRRDDLRERFQFSRQWIVTVPLCDQISLLPFMYADGIQRLNHRLFRQGLETGHVSHTFYGRRLCAVNIIMDSTFRVWRENAL